MGDRGRGGSNVRGWVHRGRGRGDPNKVTQEPSQGSSAPSSSSSSNILVKHKYLKDPKKRERSFGNIQFDSLSRLTVKKVKDFSPAASGSTGGNIPQMADSLQTPAVDSASPGMDLSTESSDPAFSKQVSDPSRNPKSTPLSAESEGRISPVPLDLVWSRRDLEEGKLFSECSPPPFIVLIESSGDNNVGKMNKLAIGILLGKVITGKRRVTPNGVNQLRVFCEEWKDGNLLVGSTLLKEKGYRAFIPKSLFKRKILVREVDVGLSASEIYDLLDLDFRDNVIEIRRRTTEITISGSDLPTTVPSENVEMTIASKDIPISVFIADLTFAATPILSLPIRCYKCQRFRHMGKQCRSAKSVCEHCAEYHDTKSCMNALRTALCSNCGGSHSASSRECPTYIFELDIMRIRSENFCGYDEAEEFLKAGGYLKPFFPASSIRAPRRQLGELGGSNTAPGTSTSTGGAADPGSSASTSGRSGSEFLRNLFSGASSNFQRREKGPQVEIEQ